MSHTTWDFPVDLLEKSVAAMRPAGEIGHEGLAIWFGEESGGKVSITHLIVPYGSGLISHPLRLGLSLRAMARLTRLSVELDRYWAGQIHSHPGLDVNLSNVDKTMGILVQDYLSIVCPHYAQRQIDDVCQFGVHIYDKGSYRRLSKPEVNSRIQVSSRLVETVTVEVLV
jgi:hypothetical protein